MSDGARLTTVFRAYPDLITGLVEGSRATSPGECARATELFLRAMGRDTAWIRALEHYGLDPKTEAPLETLTNAELSRLLGKFEARRRKGLLEAGEEERETPRDAGERVTRTWRMSVTLCSELLAALERFSVGEIEAGKKQRQAVIDKWNDFAEKTFFVAGQGWRVPYPKLCTCCGQPLLFVSRDRTRKASKSGAPGLHPWCRATIKSRKGSRRRREKERQASTTDS